MIVQLDEMKKELETANKTVDESIETVRKIKFQCAQWVSSTKFSFSFIRNYKMSATKHSQGNKWEEQTNDCKNR